MTGAAGLSPRVMARIAREYGPERSSQVAELLASLRLPLSSSLDQFEGVCGAILIVAAGRPNRLLDAAALAEVDWRDVLVAAGLADDDWPDRLQAALDEGGGQPGS